MVDHSFEETWHEYCADVHDKEFRNFNVPEDFDRSEWESVGYMPPERRSKNEPYNWSQFYDFWQWLKANGYIDE